ncbi:DUF7720 family protein [Streptococcus jiangjianxini]|uniref:DUF7720 family protein n=1 Tax=Streptococcus jiangjianxini TaxID=3161189 RepID=UPI0032EACE14
MKITELKMTTPELSQLGYEHWIDVTYRIDRKTYHLTKLLIHDAEITDMSKIKKMILSDMMELLSHAYEVLKLNRERMRENWWLF